MGQVANIRAVEFQRAVIAVKKVNWTCPVSLLDLFLSPLFPRVNLLFWFLTPFSHPLRTTLQAGMYFTARKLATAL